MRVLFDHQAFEMQRIGGVSRSYAEIISQLRLLGCNCQISIRESDNVYLKEHRLVSSLLPLHYHHNSFFGTKKVFRGQRFLTRKLLSLLGHKNDYLNINQELSVKEIKHQSFDIFEPTFFNAYFLPYLKGKPFVLTVHDMIPELYPQYFAKDDFQIIQKRILCPLATHIHVPSNRTKEDLITVLNINPDKVTVIPHGGPDLNNVKEEYVALFDFPYILYVGDRFGYKNFIPWLIEAGKVIRDNKELHIICTGKPFNDNELKYIRELHLENNVTFLFADNETFGSLYHNAIAFVYPSDYEGFGLPILEAFAYGCPVLLNDASCFPEVGGNAALYFNIKNGQSDFYDKFQYIYSMSTEDRNACINKGYERLKDFSWRKSAQQLLDIYNTIG